MNIVLLILFFNALSFFLVIVFDLEPIFSLTLHDGRELKMYFFSFSLAILDFGSFSFLRGGGWFDEPGSLGFIAFLAMVICGIFERRANAFRIAIMILGWFSFSLAFFLVSIVYYLATLKFNRKLIVVSFVGLSLVSLAISNLKEEHQDAIYSYTVGRLVNFNATNDEGRKTGDTRYHINKVAFELIERSPTIGVGERYALDYSKDFGNASIISSLAIYGIVGFVFFSAPFLFFYIKTWLVVFRRKELTRMLALVLIGLMFYQRPYWELPLNYVMLLLSFYVLSERRIRDYEC
ncbi:hypothetical protein AB6D59_11670 [Vibrio cyclitrophicus]